MFIMFLEPLVRFVGPVNASFECKVNTGNFERLVCFWYGMGKIIDRRDEKYSIICVSTVTSRRNHYRPCQNFTA